MRVLSTVASDDSRSRCPGFGSSVRPPRRRRAAPRRACPAGANARRRAGSCRRGRNARAARRDAYLERGGARRARSQPSQTRRRRRYDDGFRRFRGRTAVRVRKRRSGGALSPLQPAPRRSPATALAGRARRMPRGGIVRRARHFADRSGRARGADARRAGTARRRVRFVERSARADPNRCDRSGGRLRCDALRARAGARSRSCRCDVRRFNGRADAARVSPLPARRTRENGGDRRADDVALVRRHRSLQERERPIRTPCRRRRPASDGRAARGEPRSRSGCGRAQRRRRILRASSAARARVLQSNARERFAKPSARTTSVFRFG